MARCGQKRGSGHLSNPKTFQSNPLTLNTITQITFLPKLCEQGQTVFPSFIPSLPYSTISDTKTQSFPPTTQSINIVSSQQHQNERLRHHRHRLRHSGCRSSFPFFPASRW
ncbi:hypothetical protein BGZ61DRAFT_455832 [Ilyonectria robusta]|uniref:uncharacterized protein n=1 Tax=Ilyonectria robusta TaxID=1079257 RepID=UPI001E8DF8E0|nr:uncharacterized protein BGZ61DRAFT_455832 [Ilyonectria robusta]KAH8683409.1 hypothetical protein BGZ61DRAFT_455832 [Ilyonectria robusta]